MTSRAIVTGGAGFIGSHVVDALLRDGYEVTVVDDLSSGDAERVASDAELRELDIVDFDRLCALVEEVKPDAIFHLAAQASVVASVANPGRDCEVNVMGTLNVVESAGRVSAPVVFTSTGGALYGDDAPMPTPEDRLPAPLSPYGASKLAAEAYVKTWSLSSGIPHAVCRLGNVYGPRQNPHGEAGVVAIFSDHLYAGKAPKLYGHGKPTRDYVYVGDVVRALLAASGKAGTYNIATGIETDVTTIWRELQSAAEQTAAPGAAGDPAELAPQLADLRPGELQHSRLDISRAQQELGWSPEVPIAQGLRMTYDALVKGFEQDD
ncbi:MAG: UDP-glucose 4-epimerase [Solirubrobacteraceae bacterium]|nr:UDP-glucose 4-epimerase [Solirubrobacteraceae bacterium]MEA2151907.1 UDP-glucose 4-epimerase [Solirubrobacteraceae bacterium]MEA2225712.1 UDP-glucose 4-epimerase [Solirubrobacteraceae bacterium]